MATRAKTEKNGTRATLEISSDVLRKLKMKCAEKGEPMKARVEGLIKEWLAKEERGEAPARGARSGEGVRA